MSAKLGKSVNSHESLQPFKSHCLTLVKRQIDQLISPISQDLWPGAALNLA